jgi:uncharacterized protein
LAQSGHGDRAHEAAKWFRKAADQGLAVAQSELGVSYRSGRGVTQDDAEAAKWFRKAADQGDDKGQYNLGLLYASGQGVPQDYVLAHMWFNLSAAQGNQLATYSRDFMAEHHMTPAQIAEAQKLAREWTPKPER